MHFRFRLQLAEALGPVNRWYCSQAHGYKVDDPELLTRYFVKSGGARDFAVRYAHATGATNRWYCSEFYRQDVRDPEILWNYYLNYGKLRAEQTSTCCREAQERRNIAC